MMKKLLIAALFAVPVLGCGKPQDARNPSDAAATESGGRHLPTTEEEKQLLQQAATLPHGVKEKWGDSLVSASSFYQAASGFTCRRIFVETKSQQQTRLACGDKKGWFFVPDVYRDEPEAGDEKAEVMISSTGEATAVTASEEPGNQGEL
jgi:hypothetical protein